MDYKAIIFDLDNTLLNYSVSELKSMQKTVTKHGLIHNKSFTWDHFWNVYTTINMNYWNDRVKSNYSIYQVLEYSFNDTLKNLNLDITESKILANFYWETFCTACDFEEHAQDLLSHLHGKYRMAIISNGIGEAQRGRLSAGGIDHFFDELIISDEVGYWKPDKEIFEEALKRLDISSTDALFVGDSLQDDYYGALNAGIDFCFYNRMGHSIEKNIRPKYMIENLNKLMAI
ncbi:YjjG family noncanonical pyrimidine nucleotidase [Lederbergia wuyishanensis]|uniref:Hydrolase of the HAD superfamily n=1 Tax=Lederbergia wuyishanensis TaxID=1347903 RepID=A0ABU0D4N9_9BACI|nr:YjjG family noncanonical pyrimidine nucleotidase [Lederbergia wuyishanensis]MCJ8008055.1 YjjG family noncanonical pyrimidine nucleotidase [Lederbergia wuyishanensis]MDQ0343360.1 putative hydrolase of the HAD superfamily [Lederbergia wuyishanensis]